RTRRGPDPCLHAVVEHVDHHVEIVVIRDAEGNLALGHVECRCCSGVRLVGPVEDEAGRGGQYEESERRPEPQRASTGRGRHGRQPSAPERTLEGTRRTTFRGLFSTHDKFLTRLWANVSL